MSRPLTREEMLANERAWEERNTVTAAAIEATADWQMPWAAAALEAVKFTAKYHLTLTTDDIWAVMDRSYLPRPSEPRAMGAVMRKAVKVGYVDITGVVVQSKRAKTAEGATHHTGPVRVYRSRLA